MFNKNLDAIDNLALKRRLARISPAESRIGISYCITPSNDYILLKDDIPVDDLNNPREAIKKNLRETIKGEMNSNDIIITFGLGLGYLLDEVFNSYSSRIYVYEPDLNLLHFVLSNVDISEHLSSGRVYLTNDLDELMSKLAEGFITKDKVEIVYLQNYAIARNKELLMLTQKVFDTCKSKMVDINTITKFSKRWLQNTISNIAYANHSQVFLASELENKFVAQTALIVAAGPSLNDNIAKIQANRGKFVIFAVNKVVEHLINNGIIPDFVVCLDATNMEKTLGNVALRLTDTNCIMDVRADKALCSKPFKKVFYSFSDTDFFIKKISKYNENIKFYECGGSASTFALTLAVKMGFSKIVFAGLDLAFKDNLIYSYGETMNRVSQEEIIVDKTKKHLVQVKSVNGGMVYTREDYQAFIHHFEELIKNLNYSEIYNLSSFGAYIKGVKTISFEELNIETPASMHSAALIPTFKFEIKEFIEEEFANINNIISILSKGVFSNSLVAAILKSALIYQYLQADVLEVLQKNFAPELAQGFIDKTKIAIKTVVEALQKNHLI